MRLTGLSQGVLLASCLPELCQPVLECLACTSRELARLPLTRDERPVWIGAAPGAPTGLMYQPATPGAATLHATADGKARLATLVESAVRRIERPRGFRPADPRARAAGRVRVVGPVMRAAPAGAAGRGKARP